MIHPDAIKIMIASMTPEIFSNFPCPYGCLSSAGVSEILTEKNEIMAARRSMKEWMASERILTDPLKIPTITFMTISRELERTDNRATLTFLFIREK